MKKILLLILTLILCISFSACGHDKTKKSSADVTTTSTEKTLTRSDIVELVPTGLLNLLKYGYDYPNEVNLMQTRYEIGTIEWDNNEKEWTAYGRYTIYEKSGSMYENGSFSLIFGENGFFYSTRSKTYDKFKY